MNPAVNIYCSIIISRLSLNASETALRNLRHYYDIHVNRILVPHGPYIPQHIALEMAFLRIWLGSSGFGFWERRKTDMALDIAAIVYWYL